MSPQIVPLDPESDAGRAAAESLTDVLASIELSVAARRRKTVKVRRARTDKAA